MSNSREKFTRYKYCHNYFPYYFYGICSGVRSNGVVTPSPADLDETIGFGFLFISSVVSFVVSVATAGKEPKTVAVFGAILSKFANDPLSRGNSVIHQNRHTAYGLSKWFIIFFCDDSAATSHNSALCFKSRKSDVNISS